MLGVGELLGGRGEVTAFYNRGGGIYTSLETWGWVSGDEKGEKN